MTSRYPRSNRSDMNNLRRGLLLVAGIMSWGCVSSPPVETPFQRQLSSAIEEMLRVESTSRRNSSSRVDRNDTGPRPPRVIEVTIPFEAEPQKHEPLPSAAGAAPPGTHGWYRETGDQLVMPVLAAVRLTDTFGAPRSGGRRHQGLDLLAPRGTPVVAAAGGVVARVSNHALGGNCLWVSSADGTTYYYAHLDRFAASLQAGGVVEPGDLLGYVGTTGNAAGGAPHLHFEIHRDGEAVNPYPLLAAALPTALPRAVSSVTSR